jgi:hypothetical protein
MSYWMDGSYSNDAGGNRVYDDGGFADSGGNYMGGYMGSQQDANGDSHSLYNSSQPARGRGGLRAAAAPAFRDGGYMAAGGSGGFGGGFGGGSATAGLPPLRTQGNGTTASNVMIESGGYPMTYDQSFGPYGMRNAQDWTMGGMQNVQEALQERPDGHPEQV